MVVVHNYLHFGLVDISHFIALTVISKIFASPCKKERGGVYDLVYSSKHSSKQAFLLSCNDCNKNVLNIAIVKVAVIKQTFCFVF